MGSPEYQESVKLFENFSLPKEELVKFLNSTAKENGIKITLCEKCDSPSSKNHQGIWCDNCPGAMVDRSSWIIKNIIERSEKLFI